jgi:ABC-type sugar transport system substrate-binding protein
MKQMTRRTSLRALAAGGLLATTGCEKQNTPRATPGGTAVKGDFSDEEYVWISANANLPLFVAHDHPALHQVARDLGVRVTIGGPNSVDIPALVAAVEQTAARRPTGMMVVGWEPSALIAPINRAIESGIPVICVDGDVPQSNRMTFVGTDWYDIGVQQARVMLRVLGGRRGKVAMLGLIEQYIDQQAFAGFRSVASPAGLTVMDPMQDKGNQAEAARVATAIIQATPDLVAIAGFDSESGPGIGLAIHESGKAGQIIGTSVEAEDQQLRYIKQGIMHAGIRQKRELFTYYGVKTLFDIVHSPIRFTPDDERLGVVPVPVHLNTGLIVITRENVDVFLKG